MKSKWEVLHEYGARSHYYGMEGALNDNNEQVLFYEFNYVSQFVRFIKNPNKSNFKKLIKNIYYLIIRIIIGSHGKNVVLGIAPYNMRLPLILVLLRGANIYYHSSWPIWDGSKFVHITYFSSIKRKWISFIQHRIKTALFATERAALNFAEANETKANISVVAHSFDSKIFHSNGRENIQKELRMLFVGRLDHSKGIGDIIELAKIFPKCKVTLVGDGPMRNVVDSIAQNNSNVSYLGSVVDRKELANIYRESDILLLPSKKTENWEELFGMVIIEAMSCGVIPLVTDHVGPHEILGYKFSECLIDEEKYVEQAKLYIEYISDNPEYNKKIRIKLIEESDKFSIGNIKKIWKKALELKDETHT
jgi:glycosyltransferase involved in cell wall biosynthesis